MRLIGFSRTATQQRPAKLRSIAPRDPGSHTESQKGSDLAQCSVYLHEEHTWNPKNRKQSSDCAHTESRVIVDEVREGMRTESTERIMIVGQSKYKINMRSRDTLDCILFIDISFVLMPRTISSIITPVADSVPFHDQCGHRHIHGL